MVFPHKDAVPAREGEGLTFILKVTNNTLVTQSDVQRGRLFAVRVDLNADRNSTGAFILKKEPENPSSKLDVKVERNGEDLTKKER